MHTVVCMNMRCNKISLDPPPVYRIFLDEQLIVERRFWPDTPDYYIQEQLTMTDDDAEHNIRIKNVFADRGEIFLHDVNFFDGENRKTIGIDCKFTGEMQFTFRLTKR